MINFQIIMFNYIDGMPSDTKIPSVHLTSIVGTSDLNCRVEQFLEK